MCSTSKAPLRGNGVLTSEKPAQLSIRRKVQDSDSKLPQSSVSGCKSSEFPRFSVSPLRRFQLIDSDSDSDDPAVEVANQKANIKDSISKPWKAGCSQDVNINVEKESREFSVRKNDDLWRDFTPLKSSHVPTPAFDEICEEYFNSLKNNNVAQKVGNDIRTNVNDIDNHKRNSRSAGQECTAAEPCPPAHRYFFHDDPKIQNLVRNRLPNFFPLGVANSGNSQPHTSVINYM